MKVIIEGSTLFTKGYTGIPHYIICLHKSLKKNKAFQIYLACNLKKIKKNKNNKSGISIYWYLGKLLFSNKLSPQISHSLHSPFLQIRGTKKIATIHDLAVHLPEFDAYDFSSDYFKDKRMKLFKEFSEKADAIIAVSENTKQDFLKFFNYPENKIHVIHLAPVFKPKGTNAKNDENLLKEFSINEQKYYLTVGGISLRKNSFNLLKGYFLSAKHTNYKLVFAGKIDSKEKSKLDIYIKKNDLTNKVIFTNYISNNDLSILYKNAKAFLFPTYYEGFGIPIIEAMSYSLPVLTSNIGAAPEISKNHAILVNPHNERSISEGIIQLDQIDANKLKKAKQYADSFTWDKVAEKTIKVYESLNN